MTFSRDVLCFLMGCLHDAANVQQTSSKCIQNTRANAGRLLDRVSTLLLVPVVSVSVHGLTAWCNDDGCLS